ncbi:MAG: CAP domain-containing protein [Chitinophagaceae bacterium]|nr:MAG: CAP domain-containing protein [Chitinophagaceae bacterium]
MNGYILMKNTLLLLTLFTLAFSSCKLDDGTVLDDTPEPDENIVVVTNLDNSLILKLINERRTAGCTCGNTATGIVVMPPVPALTWNNLLAKAAAVNSVDMNARKVQVLDHNSPVTGTPTERVTATGYKWKYTAENLASGFIDEVAVVNGWTSSKGHCENFMSPLIKEMGAAKDGIYWTNVFGTKIAK